MITIKNTQTKTNRVNPVFTDLLKPDVETVFKNDLYQNKVYLKDEYVKTKDKDDETPYFEQKLTYTKDGRLMDERGYAVMMEWEDEIMKRQAEIICRNGGDILNVGFGMGMIDTYIESHRPRTHWIIEPHPDVQKKIIEDGWLKKPHVKVIFATWQDVYKHLPKFDGIYIDTWDEVFYEFHENIENILKPDGIYSYFNNPRDDEHGLHTDPAEYQMLEHKMNMDFEAFEIDWVSDWDTQSPDGDERYWDPTWTTYYAPVFTLKQEYR